MPDIPAADADFDSHLGEQASPAGPRGTLLVVDDEDGPRQSLRAVFKDDFHVLTAADGPTALACAETNKIDVAVLDIRLGSMSGIELLERLKLADPSIDVIMMTAFETADTMRQAMSLRACGYITKPFDLATMRSAVANAMLGRSLSSSSDQKQLRFREALDHKIQEQMSATRGDIYASILHDINGPLTAISGFVKLMSQRFGNTPDVTRADVEFVKERLGSVSRQVANCIEISRRYLSFLSQQPETLPLISVNQVLSDVDHILILHPSLSHNQFNLQPLAQDMAVRVNGTDLMQILLNLVVNALQCSAQPHLVEMCAWIVPDLLDLLSFKDGPHDRFIGVEHFDNTPPFVAVAIRDDGPGIPEQVLPKIFQPYFTTKAQDLGAGLGLSIVQRLIKRAKGALLVHTRPKEGTTFTAYIPAAPLR
jgi:signal transduction histidine kinase